jgi:hypothetical protein
MHRPTSPRPTVPSGPQSGAHESPESTETFPQRTKRPGQVGLANEARPGLGTRGTDADPRNPEPAGRRTDSKVAEDAIEAEPPHPPERKPTPAEQDSDSLAQEQQRSTGVSGHAGGT